MSLIIMSKKVREFELPTPSTQLSGHFKLEVINPTTGKVKRSMEFDNLILNNGLNRFTATTQSSVACVNRICIGTGTSVPDILQTSLSSFSASVSFTPSSNIQTASTVLVGQEYSYTNTRMRFVAGTLNGNYTEVGIGWANDQLFSRALIVDAGGNPTSITVLSDEALDVTYTLRMYIPQSDVSGSVTITGVGTDIPLTIRAGIVRISSSYGSSGSTVSRPWDSGFAGWALTDTSSYGLISANSGGFFNTSAGSMYGNSAVWCSPTTRTTMNTLTSTSYTSAGSITALSDVSLSTQAYVTNNFYKNTTVVFGLNAFNSTYRHLVAGFNSMGAYQYLLDTPITKTSSQILTLNFRCSWARRTI